MRKAVKSITVDILLLSAYHILTIERNISMNEREKFSSRLGFILISAGCSIGLGNVWRFPYIVGEYGGAAFVLVYLFFLVAIGLPIMAMEFSVGRASRKSVASGFKVLQPEKTKWHLFGYVAMGGNYLLMMFYNTIGGWMIAYFFKMLKGKFDGVDSNQVENIYHKMVESPQETVFWTIVVVVLGFGICSLGLKNGVERITKVMMSSLFIIMIILVVRSFTLPGMAEGLSFYLKPDFSKMAQAGIFNVISAAMGQAFFTLSIGMGSMQIFGSYIDKQRSLTGEALSIMALDTFVAILSGLIVFPACFSFGVSPESGPNLVFITLPNIFNSMQGGRIWGTLFFAFMSFTALSTTIAVFENIISFAVDLWGTTRKKAVLFNLPAVIILSLPCALGFNLLSDIQPLGAGSTIMDLEDFIVSNNILPLGALVYVAFCVTKHGWGWENFYNEVNTGKGIHYPSWLKNYLKYVIVPVVLFIFVQGYISI